MLQLYVRGTSRGVIAARYAVNISTVHNLVRRKTWKQLPWPVQQSGDGQAPAYFGASAAVSPGGKIRNMKVDTFSPGLNGPGTLLLTGSTL